MSRTTVGVIQARTGSTRLPGKVMFPLGGHFGLEHVIQRVRKATEVDVVVVATSTKKPDDVIGCAGERGGARVFRGDEENVLERVYRAAKSEDADEVLRITADCPLLDPPVVDEVVQRRRLEDADYAANIIERTFPRGLDVEVFTFDSLERVRERATQPSHREHVTPYYRENPDEFDLVNVTSEAVFDEEWLQNRTDLRLTLDEAADYKLLYEVFENLEYDEYPSFREAVRYIDEEGLGDLNADVVQKDADDASGG